MSELFWLVKFSEKKHHLESLMNLGDVFFNHVINYSESHEPGRGDSNEGAISIENTQFKSISFDHPILGEGTFNPMKNSLGKIKIPGAGYLSHSLYAISSEIFKNLTYFQISEKMKDFGEHALIIKKPYEFLNSIANELNRKKIGFKISPITYIDLSKEGKFNITPFIKDLEYTHQYEYRIIIGNTVNTKCNICIGPIVEYCELTTTEAMTEIIWEAKREG